MCHFTDDVCVTNREKTIGSDDIAKKMNAVVVYDIFALRQSQMAIRQKQCYDEKPFHPDQKFGGKNTTKSKRQLYFFIAFPKRKKPIITEMDSRGVDAMSLLLQNSMEKS